MDKRIMKKSSILIFSIILVGLFSLHSVLANSEANFGVSINVISAPIIDQNNETLDDEDININSGNNFKLIDGIIGLFIGLFALHIISITTLKLKKNPA